ncbi:MAG TPA: hypothetical protein VLL54_14555 [Pyrinomonadaceae bacterium]|nr:hypothetical protein [Pyrinomonadaceae bacterium]
MPTQRIIWTVLPNGFQGNVLRLSVFVSPRLYNNSDTQLGNFPDFADWPAHLKNVNFGVEFKGGPTIKAKVTGEQPDSNLWTTIFKHNTFVRAYKFPEHHKRRVRTYPVAQVMEFMKDLWTNVGDQSPTDLPKFSSNKSTEQLFTLDNLFNQLGNLRARRDEIAKHLDTELSRQSVKAFNPEDTQGMDKLHFAFTQLDLFYDRKRNKNLRDEQLNPKPVRKRIAKPKLDFHQMISGLGDYPGLERKIGIVIDLELEVPAGQVASLLASHSIRLRPQWTSPASAFNNDFAPWTKLLPARFVAEPKPNSDLAMGLVRLANVNARFMPNVQSSFDLVQLDVDSASMKTLDFATNMRRWLTRPRAYTAPDEGGLPAFRTTGLSLVKRGRAFRTAQGFQDMAPNNQAVESSPPSVDMNPPVLLFADDLVRGYRVDIFDKTAPAPTWRSLCKRIGNYSFPGASQAPLEISDEGYVKGASASSTVDGANDSDLYLHETMFQWEGWSLSAPRPGKTIVAETYDSNGNPLPEQNEKVDAVQNSASGIEGVNLETNFAAQPGTLPRLRFGHTYRMRARATDLAGNSVSAESTDASHASEEHTYARFDPIVPPAILLRERVTDGESVERMVIRSNFDKKAADYVELAQVKTAIQNKDYQYHEGNERHIAPPKTSQQMAELHGKFDEFVGFDPNTNTKKDYDRGYKLALKETGTFLDTEVYDHKTDTKKAVAGIELVTPKSVPANPPPPTLPLNPPGSALAAGQYVIHKEEELLLPYLPDPFARGVAFVGLPHVSGVGPIAPDQGATKVQLNGLNPQNPGEKVNVLKVRFDGAWPDSAPFRIRIVEGTGEPTWNHHVLTVPLPKAEVARVRFSSYLNKEDLMQMGVWGWLTKQVVLENHALAGQHWMITPFRQLELVHAVQQPLKEPKFYKMQTKKQNLGDTFALFQGNIDLSVKSTNKIEVHAKWMEWIDSLSEKGPRQLSLEGNTFEIKLEQSAADMFSVDPFTPRHEFHDTKYRAIAYEIIATTRFREFFPPEITSNPENITRRSKPETFKILNSARPAAPKVLYVVPTFRWDPPPSAEGDRPHQWKAPLGDLALRPDNSRVARGKVLESKRTGNGLRVYLERPWYSSGDEEKLGVVIREGAKGGGPGVLNNILAGLGGSNAPPNDPLKPYVTEWGQDPLWSSVVPKPSPSIEDFKLATASKPGVTLDELPNATVSVAGHDVEYDEDRKLWFCDIEIDAGNTYYPFVRMALARFQPNSLNDAHLSRVVMTDFAQLTPDRAAAVTFDLDNHLSVAISGYCYKSSSVDVELPDHNMFAGKKVHGNPITISLEAQRIGTDLGWVPIPRSDVDLLPEDGANGISNWQGRIALPRDRDGYKLRLVIREFEVFIGGPEAHIETRVVYADLLEL